MHILVPCTHPHRDHAALDTAAQLAHAGDTITALACAVVPAYYAVDVISGAIWGQTCRADRTLARAEAHLTQTVTDGVTVRVLRVQARDEASAIVAGATQREADLILMGGWPVPFRGIGARFGVAGIVARHVTCGVQVVSATTHSAPVREVAVPRGAGDTRNQTHPLSGEYANDGHTRDNHRA